MDFSFVYDELMDEVPYEEWAAYVQELLNRYGLSQKDEDPFTVVELGCGTGSFTQEMAKRGYNMIGIDNSPEMLNVAVQKKDESGLEILYLEQDMRDFELIGPVANIVSVCDSVNYLLSEEEILQMMACVKRGLLSGGIFVFDFNTVHKYRDVIGDTTIAESREDVAFIWDNYYNAEECINEYDLTIFRQIKGDRLGQDLFQRSLETHFQKGYTLAEMECYARKSGLSFVKAIDADTHGNVTENSERVYVILRNDRK